MSNFDLPPLLGFDPQLKHRLPFGGRIGQEPGPAPRLPGELPLADGETAIDGLGSGAGRDQGFTTVLDDSVGRLNALQADVDSKVRGLVLGDDVELHDVMLAINKSEVAFNLMLEVRNKLVDAWDKLSRSAT